MLLLAVGFVALTAAPVFSKNVRFFTSFDQVHELLASDEEWILERWEQRMGAGAGCLAGASYFFVNDGTVKIERCAIGTVETQVCEWTLIASAEGLSLSLCGEKYDVRMREASGITQMALTLLTNDKGTISSFLEFTLAD